VERQHLHLEVGRLHLRARQLELGRGRVRRHQGHPRRPPRRQRDQGRGPDEQAEVPCYIVCFSMLAAPAFDNYTVLGSIGAGGMAELFLAERAGVEGARRRVVLKRTLPAYAADPDFRELFAHEARIAMQLNHANVVQVYDFRESGDTYLLEME